MTDLYALNVDSFSAASPGPGYRDSILVETHSVFLNKSEFPSYQLKFESGMPPQLGFSTWNNSAAPQSQS